MGRLCDRCVHDGCCDDLPFCGGSCFKDAHEEEEAACENCIHFDGDECEAHMLPNNEDAICGQYERQENT